MRRALVLVLALIALPSSRARAYNEAVHASLTRRAFAGRTAWLAEPLPAPTEAELTALRARFWILASQSGDPALRAEFLARFPSADALDAWAFKELLMLNPAARVHGFDDAQNESARSRETLLLLASRWPDDDKRNQSRIQRDAARQPILDPQGAPLPFDPATLSLGAVTGQSSQGHAHYGLLRGPFSEDPAVLQRDPRHFALPADAQSWGAQFAQLYTDLAVVAHGSQLPSRGYLEATFSGAAFHHLEDVSNQIHTIQVGIFEFFEAAFLQSKERDLLTLGGLLGPRAPLRELGLHLVFVHHLLLEDLFAKRMLEDDAGKPVGPDLSLAFSGLGNDEPSLVDAARASMSAARQQGKGEIEALAYDIIESSSFEGPDCYRLIWRLSAPVLHDGRGYSYDGANGDDPDNFIVASGAAGQETLGRFYALESIGAHRATTALRLWQTAFDAEVNRAGADQRAVDRILALVLPYQREAARRRAAYHHSAEVVGVAWGYPVALALLILVPALLFLRFSKRFAPRAEMV
jgi:hypothetical protein